MSNAFGLSSHRLRLCRRAFAPRNGGARVEFTAATYCVARRQCPIDKVIPLKNGIMYTVPHVEKLPMCRERASAGSFLATPSDVPAASSAPGATASE